MTVCPFFFSFLILKSDRKEPSDGRKRRKGPKITYADILEVQKNDMKRAAEIQEQQHVSSERVSAAKELAATNKAVYYAA